MKERRPIFYDVERVRWRRTRRGMEITGALLTALLAYFFVTIAVSVDLPASLLPDTKPGYHALKTKKKPLLFREGRRRRVANIGKVPASYDPLRAAFYVSWDPNSLASLKKHYKDIDLLIPEQLHAVTPDGAMTIVDYNPNGQRTVKASPAEAIALLREDKLHQWMKSLNPPIELPMMGLVNNYDGATWRVKEMVQMLASPGARRNLVRDVVEYAVESHEAGIVVDFEEVPDASQPHFREFIGELAPALHLAGLKLMIALPARDDAYDYQFFGKQCDAVVLMNYDQHWLTSPPGPIAAQDWFVENMRQVLEVVPAQKIVVGIANYAYDWSAAPKKQYEPAAEFSIQEALLHAFESEADVEFDSDSLNPHYSYYDEHNHVHQVWMLDAITAYNQLRACERLGVQGTALWRLGSADTSIWPSWDATRPDDAIRQKLTDLPPGPDLILEGDGDIWHITDTPKHGRRSFQYDAASDLFTDESYDAIPLSYNIDQIGGAKKKLAISFDDGPDPRWTPKILDILKQKNVPAVFFVIGNMANQRPDILKREYAEGHEIGNHTFTHPKFDDITRTELRWQLNLTERLIESTLGVKSILFRPPYGIDHQPEYAEEVAQLPYPQELGYLIVGQRIDPDDWSLRDGKPVPANEIVDSVLRQAGKGNIILLHDGGGERDQTVAALPQLIDALRAQGYQFVSVSDLLGKTRANVMVPLSAQEQLEARIDGIIFSLFQWLRFFIGIIFFLGIVLVSGRAVIIGLLALIEKLRPDRAVMPDPPPSVTVLIPAHNEESVIVQTVTSVLVSDFKDLHLIVVNDGSTDTTGELLEENFSHQPRVRIIHQVNRGKAAALNLAMSQANTEIVVTIDADTEIEPDAISKLIRHFADPRVGAVAGNVKVGNRSRWLTRWQALEYIASQNMEKRAFGLLNCAQLHYRGARRAGCLAREGYRGRRRDYRGYGCRGCRSDHRHSPPWMARRLRRRSHRLDRSAGKTGTAHPPAFPLDLWHPAVLLEAWRHASAAEARNARLDRVAEYKSVLFFLAFLLIDILTCVVAFALERKEDWTLLIPVLLQRFYYRQLMYVVLFRSVKEAVSGRPVGWRGVEPEHPAPKAPPKEVVTA